MMAAATQKQNTEGKSIQKLVRLACASACCRAEVRNNAELVERAGRPRPQPFRLNQQEGEVRHLRRMDAVGPILHRMFEAVQFRLLMGDGDVGRQIGKVGRILSHSWSASEQVLPGGQAESQKIDGERQPVLLFLRLRICAGQLR